MFTALVCFGVVDCFVCGVYFGLMFVNSSDILYVLN